ncbi:MAG: hypothetical protein IJ728_12760 [Selenomonadaceae bacterium]|nr:hypothetical protein [Selenomonadaceae bacterium]
MDTDNGTNGVNLNELFYIGVVTSYGETPGTVKITRPDKDDRVSADLPVIQLCVKDNQFFHMPQINEQVLVLQLPNAGGKGVCDGYVLGAFYNEVDTSIEQNNEVYLLRMKDGCYIRFDGEGNIELHATKKFFVTVGEQVRMNKGKGRY